MSILEGHNDNEFLFVLHKVCNSVIQIAGICSDQDLGDVRGHGYAIHAQKTYRPRLIRLIKVTHSSFMI